MHVATCTKPRHARKCAAQGLPVLFLGVLLLAFVESHEVRSHKVSAKHFVAAFHPRNLSNIVSYKGTYTYL